MTWSLLFSIPTFPPTQFNISINSKIRSTFLETTLSSTFNCLFFILSIFCARFNAKWNSMRSGVVHDQMRFFWLFLLLFVLLSLFSRMISICTPLDHSKATQFYIRLESTQLTLFILDFTQFFNVHRVRARERDRGRPNDYDQSETKSVCVALHSNEKNIWLVYRDMINGVCVSIIINIKC